MTESKIVHVKFQKRTPRTKTRDQLAADVRNAWRKLGIAIKQAKLGGLEVELMYDNKEPVIRQRL